MPATTLIDTREHSTAILLGYDGARDPREDGEGLIVLHDASTPASVALWGADGQVELCGVAEIEAVAAELNRIVARIRRGQLKAAA